MKRNAGGYAMIMVICAMAIVVVLCLALLLTSSIVLSSAQKEISQEQCRAAAVSLSQEFEKQLTDQAYTFRTKEEETNGRDTGLWFFMKDSMTNHTWPYYSEGERGHTAKSAYKTFHLDSASIPAAVTDKLDCDDIQIVMYWESENGWDELGASTLTMEVTCKVNGQSCTIKSVYALSISTIITQVTDPQTGKVTAVTYDQWKWSLDWRE